ncbi:MAG: hypothetical protein SGARI_007319 [Bacillariaceae sp.]
MRHQFCLYLLFLMSNLSLSNRSCVNASSQCILLNRSIPVPREPFSFGGLYGTKSKYGDMDITGDGAMEFFSNRIKVTSKWPLIKPPAPSRKRDHSEMASAQADSANFAGQM